MTIPHLLTIDLGTSGPKAAVVDAEGRIAGSARRSVTTVHGVDGSAVQDPEAVWRATVDAAVDALTSARRPREAIVGIVASAQYSSIVPVEHDGRPIGPMITWMDHRGAPARLRELPGFPRWADRPDRILRSVRRHGLAPIEAGMSLNHMRWMRFGDPERYERADSLLEPVDYLTARFTGRCTANRCSSLMQLLSDNRDPTAAGDRAPDWDPILVGMTLIDPVKLPQRVPTGSIVGPLRPDVAEELGLAPTTPVLSGLNDTQAGAIAAGAWRGDHAGLAIGTTSVIATHVARKKLNPLRTLFTMPSPIGETHLLAAENGVAGAAVDHLLDHHVHADDEFGHSPATEDRHRAFDAAVAAAEPGASGLLFLPWLAGSLAPDADPRMRGGFIGMGLDTTRRDLARAIAEGVAANLRRLQGPVERFIGRDIGSFVFYGGGSGSPAWAGVLADVLDRPVERVANGGFANSLGTAIFGFDSLGIVAADDLAGELPIADRFEPDPEHRGRYDDLVGRLDEAFRRTRPLMRRLSNG